MAKLEVVGHNDKKYATEIPYSTEEVRIGTWLDGKPLYSVTVTGTISSDSSVGYYDMLVASISNMNQLISATGYVKTSAGLSFSLGSYYDNNRYSSVYQNGNQDGRIRLMARSGFSGGSFMLILKYTKTTD